MLLKTKWLRISQFDIVFFLCGDRLQEHVYFEFGSATCTWATVHNDRSCRGTKIQKTHTSYDVLVGCFGFNGPLRQYFSLYRAVSQREGERGERIDESKNVQTTRTRTYCKCSRPLPYCNPNCRTPRHWKFTQHHRTTRPPPMFWYQKNMIYSRTLTTAVSNSFLSPLEKKPTAANLG